MTVMEAIYRTKIIFHLKFPNTHIHTYTNTHTHTYTHTHTHTHTLTHTNTWKKILQPHPTPSFIPYRLTNLQNISIDGICGQLLMCIQNFCPTSSNKDQQPVIIIQSYHINLTQGGMQRVAGIIQN